MTELLIWVKIGRILIHPSFAYLTGSGHEGKRPSSRHDKITDSIFSPSIHREKKTVELLDPGPNPMLLEN